MDANEKHAAAMHGFTPSTADVREEYRNGRQFGELYSKTDFRAEFDRWLETVRAEAKAEALNEVASEIDRLDSDVEMYDENLNARQVSHWLRTRVNQYKEAQSA